MLSNTAALRSYLATAVAWREPGLMLVELSVVEQRYHTVPRSIQDRLYAKYAPSSSISARYTLPQGTRLAGGVSELPLSQLKGNFPVRTLSPSNVCRCIEAEGLFILGRLPGRCA